MHKWQHQSIARKNARFALPRFPKLSFSKLVRLTIIFLQGVAGCDVFVFTDYIAGSGKQLYRCAMWKGDAWKEIPWVFSHLCYEPLILTIAVWLVPNLSTEKVDEHARSEGHMGTENRLLDPGRPRRRNIDMVSAWRIFLNLHVPLNGPTDRAPQENLSSILTILNLYSYPNHS